MGVNNLIDNYLASRSGKITGINNIISDTGSCFIHQVITREINLDAADYISESIDLNKSDNILFSYKDKVYCNNIESFNAIINLKQINDIRNLREYMVSLNKLLPDGGMYIGCAENYWGRKIKVYNRFKYKQLAAIAWFIDNVFHRVVPRLYLIRDLYKFIHHNKYKSLSTAEILGRLVHCGFEVIGYRNFLGKLVFIVMKTREPQLDITPTYGPFVKLRRIGKRGEVISVFKFRTMNPYSEFIQDFIIKLNGYNKVGKPANDFRLTRWGKFLRKYWLDEIPQIINVLKGELAIVGVRPLSFTRYNELPEDVKTRRINYKPGCIPPYVALNMPDACGNIEAERIYFNDLEKAPRYLVNLRYFFMALRNILSRKIVSA